LIFASGAALFAQSPPDLARLFPPLGHPPRRRSVEAAHRRGDLFKRRQVLMLDWETYCARGEAEDTVVKLSAPYQSTSLSRYDTVS